MVIKPNIMMTLHKLLRSLKSFLVSERISLYTNQNRGISRSIKRLVSVALRNVLPMMNRAIIKSAIQM